MHRRALLTVLTGVITLAGATPCHAQWSVGARGHEARERSDAKIAAGCRDLVAALRAGPSGPGYAHAIQIIRECEESGPPALGAVWQQAQPERRMLEQLMGTSAHLRDRRLAATVVRVALDPGRPELVRLASLSVLTRFADSTVYVSLDQLLQPREGRALGSIFDFAPVTGAQPLRTEDLREIREALRRLAAGDPNPRVRAAAQFLDKELALRDRIARSRRPG